MFNSDSFHTTISDLKCFDKKKEKREREKNHENWVNFCSLLIIFYFSQTDWYKNQIVTKNWYKNDNGTLKNSYNSFFLNLDVPKEHFVKFIISSPQFLI